MSVKISVVTPSYNQADFLEQTLRSVIGQRDLIHEYFVLDGGSDDGSVQIIKRYADHIDDWVSAPDNGQCDAIHQGFSKCTGDVLYWINSDDILLPGALQHVHEAFDAQPDLDVVTGYSVAIDADDRILRVRRRVHDSPWWGRLGYLRITQPTCFFRRELYESVGGLDLDLHCCLDTDLWYKMYTKNSRWGGVDEYLAAFRLHDQAKGSALLDQYEVERAIMKRRHPKHTGRKITHSIGHLVYYAAQFGSGRERIARRDRKEYTGRTLREVFGDLPELVTMAAQNH